MVKTFAIVMIVLGLIGLIWGGISYTTREKVLDLGPIEATQEKRHTIPLPPIAGAVLVLSGVVLLAAARKQVRGSA